MNLNSPSSTGIVADVTRPSWDILITSIPHRHRMLCELLAELNAQIENNSTLWNRPVGVILYRDNLEVPYGDKTQMLLDTARAEYVSCIDDDDTVAPDYIRRVLAALETKPDYVGYPIWWTRDGEPQTRIEHSLRHYGWGGNADLIWRDISEKNPILRELAMLGRWSGGWEADRRWAEVVRSSGRVKNETWIPDPMYYYREVQDESFRADREPFPEPLPPLPYYTWLTVITGE